jgi:hypothetical protein
MPPLAMSRGSDGITGSIDNEPYLSVARQHATNWHWRQGMTLLTRTALTTSNDSSRRKTFAGLVLPCHRAPASQSKVYGGPQDTGLAKLAVLWEFASAKAAVGSFVRNTLMRHRCYGHTLFGDYGVEICENLQVLFNIPSGACSTSEGIFQLFFTLQFTVQSFTREHDHSSFSLTYHSHYSCDSWSISDTQRLEAQKNGIP